MNFTRRALFAAIAAAIPVAKLRGKPPAIDWAAEKFDLGPISVGHIAHKFETNLLFQKAQDYAEHEVQACFKDCRLVATQTFSPPIRLNVGDTLQITYTVSID